MFTLCNAIFGKQAADILMKLEPISVQYCSHVTQTSQLEYSILTVNEAYYNMINGSMDKVE